MKKLLLLTFGLLIILNNVFSQIEPDENSTASSNVNGTLNKVLYNKCDGTLYISFRTSGNAGVRALFKSYIYIKVGGQWKNMLTIRGEDQSSPLATHGAAMNSPYAWNSTQIIPFYGLVNAANHTNGATRNNTSGTIEAGHIKRRVAYYSGAWNLGYWASYEDEAICENYSTTNLALLSKSTSFTPFLDAPAPAVNHGTGIQNNLGKIGVYPTTDTEWGLEFGIVNVPRGAIIGNSISVRVYKNYRDIFNWTNTTSAKNDYEYQEYSVSTNLPDGPQGLSASTNECGKVKLNWINPAQTWSSSLNCTEAQNYDIGIYRDGALIKIIDGTLDAYIDIDNGTTNNLIPRQVYDYTVKTILWNKDNKSYRISASSNLEGGSMKLPPAQPSPFNASDNKCNTRVNISWSQPNGTPANSYKLLRYLGGTLNKTVALTASTRAYVDSTVTRGSEYNYKLVAFNDCSYPSDTASVLGISPSDPAPATNLTITTDIVNSTFTVGWTDVATNESKYQIKRQDQNGNTVFFDLNPNTTSFLDNGAGICTEYTYTVLTINSCKLAGVLSASTVVDTLPPPNLQNTFDATTNYVTGSKGYYNNRVELSWSNNNSNILSNIKIYRKPLGSTTDSVQVGVVTSGSGLYVDYTTDAGVFYKYTLSGEADCVGNAIKTNSTEDIGFRNPTGIINGHIEYDGGVAVSGVSVEVNPTVPTGGYALKLNGTNFVEVPDNATLKSPNYISAEAWVRSTASTPTTQKIIEKQGTYSLKYNYTTAKVEFTIKVNGVDKTVSYPFTGGAAGDVISSSYTQICGLYNGTYTKLFINGIAVDSVSATGLITTSTNNVKIGEGLVGTLDEVRIWDNQRTNQEIKQDYSVFKTGAEGGVVLLYHTDEGFMENVYDISKTGNGFNENHGKFNPTSSATWSSIIPNTDQLGYGSITNSTGDYTVGGVRYYGTGTSYNVSPVKGVHEFAPTNKVLFIGDGASVQNGVDFLDKSSFIVHGYVKYARRVYQGDVNNDLEVNYKDYPCSASNILVYIDNNVVIKNNNVVETDVNGYFDIRVPIGNHVVSVGKLDHEFSSYRFPTDTVHDFQEDIIPNLTFIDSTFMTVAGRVVGGTVEQAKPNVFGRSVNNVGQAKLTFIATNGCLTDQVITVDTSGEYSIRLPLLKYKKPVYSANPIPASSAIQFVNDATKGTDFTDNSTLDLTLSTPLQTIYDSVFIAGTPPSLSHIDTLSYHKWMEYIVRNQPQIYFANGDSTDQFKGEQTYAVINQGVSDTLDVSALATNIFLQKKKYDMRLYAVEEYTNADDNVVSKVPVTVGQWEIQNGLGRTDGNIELLDVEGSYTPYTFIGGFPETASPFTRDFKAKITYGSGGTKTATKIFTGYLSGSKSLDGQSFVSKGPALVEHILRDPPGSNSYTFLQQGSTITTTKSFSVGGSTNSNLSTSINAGASFSVGLGMSVETDISVDASTGTSTEKSVNEANEFTEAITIGESWTTSGSAETPGAMSDVYIGKSMNVNFGVSNQVELIDENICISSSSVDCAPTIAAIKNGINYKMGRRLSLEMVPGGYGTEFAYEQNHIINYLIPRLKLLRAQVFTDPTHRLNECYVMNPVITALGDTHPLYAVNNDDPMLKWPIYAALGLDTTGAPFSTEPADFGTTGGTTQIYEFKRGFVTVAGNECFTDTLRWFNQQIRLWEEAIANNEREKIAATTVNNRSFSSGVSVEWSETVDTENATTIEFETSMTKDVSLAVGVEVNGTGMGLDMGLAISMSTGKSSQSSVAESTTWGYVLFDENQGDFFSVDIKDAKSSSSPIFAIQAGESECPWEEAGYTYYAQGSGTPIQLSGGTISRQVPRISVDNQPTAERINVPADQPAIFTLQLFNDAPFDTKVYDVTVLQDYNQDGAKIRIGGGGAGDLISVAIGANGMIQQQLEVERGSGAIYQYDSLAILIKSQCQYAYGTSNVRDIGDTVFVSVKYIPTCESIDVFTPDFNWVLNNNFNDTMLTGIDTYDINNEELKTISLEYKPAQISDWTQIGKWWKSNQLFLSPNPDTLEIPVSSSVSLIDWIVDGLPDGDYDIRAKSECLLAEKYSVVYSGVIDRINPHPFGTPSPADGILSPNDDISIQFNEPIDLGAASDANFDIRGVLNGAEFKDDASLYFNGVDNDVRITNGINLTNSSTIEMWIKRNTNNVNEVFFSQGVNAAQSYNLGFNTSNQLTIQIENKLFNSVGVINDNSWHHIACSFDKPTTTVQLMIDGSVEGTNNGFFAEYTEGGDIFIGKSTISNAKFNGNIHEVRIWNKAIANADLSTRKRKTLSGQEFGLVGVWPMDEAIGTVVSDKARSRHGIINGATWSIYPTGQAINFDGLDDDISYNTSQIVFTSEMDFTIEFWFNANVQADTATLFSNGKGDEFKTWAIYTDNSGKLFVKNNNTDIIAVSTNYFDGNWHHFSMVAKRTSNVSFYIDGNLESSLPAGGFGEFGSQKVWLGARGYYIGMFETKDQFFDGNMDDVRLWSLSRKQEQIRRDMVNRLLGDEYGLMLYLPFEEYVLVNSVPTLTPAFKNIVTDSLAVPNNGVGFDGAVVPNIKLPRPVTAIPFAYSINGDKIIITPNIGAERIENVTLDITTRGIKDLQGNEMQSAKTWIAYIDKNQVIWENTDKVIEIELEGTYSFNANILNIGGQLKEYTISNVPNWLQVSQTSGTILPNSIDQLTFTVVQGVNIGTYEQDIYLTTDFGYNEAFHVSLKVKATSPNWTVDPGNFQYSMSVIGRIRVDSIISTDLDDKLVATVNGVSRGVANLEYFEQYDAYLVFLDVYSNSPGGDTIEFYVWDASAGKTHIEVTPNLSFEDNKLYGMPGTPQVFDAINIVSQPITVTEGWNWISFNLENPIQSDVNKLMIGVNSENGDILKGLGSYDQYSSSIGWVGSITAAGGVDAKSLYKFKTSNADTIDYSGSKINPTDIQIPIDSGWSWIGFVALKNVTVANAFGNYNVSHGDLLKGQTSFAVYDSILGWVGNLDFMIPNRGYMYKSTKNDTLTYPNSAVFSYKTAPNNVQEKLNESVNLIPEKYQYNMNMIVMANLCENKVNDYQLIATSSNEVIGIADSKNGQFYLTIYGNGNTDIISFNIRDKEGENYPLEETFTFVSNRVEGSVNEPVQFFSYQLALDKCEELSLSNVQNETTTNVIEIQGEEDITVAPSLFNDVLYFNYILTEQKKVSIEMYSITGTKIATIINDTRAPGTHKITWNTQNKAPNLAAGSYFIRIKMGTDKEIIKKIIKQ